MARAVLVASALALALIFGCLRIAYARAGEALLDFGQEFSALTASRLASQTRILTMNNLQLRLVTASTSIDVHEAMNRLHGFCSGKGGAFLPESVAKRLAVAASGDQAGILDGVYSYEAKNAGVVACIDTGGQLPLDDLTARLSRFAKSGDLSSLGQLRYALFHRSGKSTSVLALWTEGTASVFDMFPATGDAPGTDPRDFPRPMGVRRLLSAAERGQPYAVTVYETEGQSPEQLREWYRTALLARKWSLIRTPYENGLAAKSGARIVNVVIGVSSMHHSTITVAELS